MVQMGLPIRTVDSSDTWTRLKRTVLVEDLHHLIKTAYEKAPRSWFFSPEYKT